MPTIISLDGQCFNAAYRFQDATARPEIALSLRRSLASTGELTLEGEFINYLFLKGCGSGPPTFVALHSPAPRCAIPVGDYAGHLYIDSRPSAAPLHRDIAGPITIRRGKAATLRAGAPLRHSFTATRKRDAMTVEYDLLGIGNQSYKRCAIGKFADRSPVLVLRKGNTVFHQHTFDYG